MQPLFREVLQTRMQLWSATGTTPSEDVELDAIAEILHWQPEAIKNVAQLGVLQRVYPLCKSSCMSTHDICQLDDTGPHAHAHKGFTMGLHPQAPKPQPSHPPGGHLLRGRRASLPGVLEAPGSRALGLGLRA